jgi:hypothetical protein
MDEDDLTPSIILLLIIAAILFIIGTITNWTI